VVTICDHLFHRHPFSPRFRLRLASAFISFRRTNLPAGTAPNWPSLIGGFCLTNGVVEIDRTNTVGLPSGFNRVIEH
jgi:hypothetical protein